MVRPHFRLVLLAIANDRGLGHNTFGDVRVTTREENGQYEFYDENDENTLQKSEAEAFSHGR
jgi:hypothetical protein